MTSYDVVIIGAGVIGCSIAWYLSRYEANILVVEREEDVCSGTSKANSGIVHAGFDAKPGSLMAKMNVKGSEMIKELSKQLDFPYVNNGSIVICLHEEERDKLQELYERGLENGVKGMRILTGKEARTMESSLSPSVVAALWAPSAGIVCPFSMTIAMAENAAENGVEFRFLTQIQDITRDADQFLIKTQQGEVIKTKTVVNAAGVYADVFHNMVSGNKLDIHPKRGEYVLLDKEVGKLVTSTIFQLPNKFGKGVLVTPTVHGNILVGPNSHDLKDREETETTQLGIEEVEKKAINSVPDIPFGKIITSFSGLRAHEKGGDFILGEPNDCRGFFDAAGIESPGLSSAPAIGEYIAEEVSHRLHLVSKRTFNGHRKGIKLFASLTMEEQRALLAEKPEYGNIVCRCEMISEGEIREAIHRPLGARSLDGIKRRVRQGMGRCQAGFCTPKAMEILADELGIPVTAVCKNRPGSELLDKEL